MVEAVSGALVSSSNHQEYIVVILDMEGKLGECGDILVFPHRILRMQWLNPKSHDVQNVFD